MSLLLGLLIGFLINIPIGPINILVVNNQLKKKTNFALAISFGAAVMDFTYFFIILSGLSFINLTENFKFLFQLIGALVIFTIGIKETFFVKSIERSNQEKVPLFGIYSAVFFGMTIYATNPTLVITMSGLATFISSLALFEMSLLNVFFISMGLFLGSMGWFYFLVKIVGIYRNKILDKYYTHFIRVSGGLLIILSLYIFLKIFTKMI